MPALPKRDVLITAVAAVVLSTAVAIIPLAARGRTAVFEKMGTGSNFGQLQLQEKMRSGGAEIRACTRFFRRTEFHHGLLVRLHDTVVLNAKFTLRTVIDQYTFDKKVAPAPFKI